MINCDNCGVGVPFARFLRRFMRGPWTVLRCPSCGALLSASEATELLCGLLALGGGTIGGVFAIYGHERLGWTEPGVLAFAVGAVTALGIVLGVVIWQHGSYSSRASGIEEFVEGDRATRLKVIAGTAMMLLILLLSHLTFPDAALRETDPMQAFKKSVDHLLILALPAVLFSIGMPIYCLRLAIKVRRSGQWPPPGMRMPARTRIVRGGRAKLNAILLCFLGTVAIVPGPELIYVWLLGTVRK